MTRPDRRPTVIIVGSGAAGLFAAARLVEVAEVTLLEAGVDAGSPPPRWLLDDLALGDGLDWGLSDAESGMHILRGKVTGGSTSTNSAAALRGQPWDFDEWDLDGWRWSDVEADFAAIETDRQFGDRPGHGDEGPLPITRLSFGPLDDSFAAWAQRQGHAWVEDHNAPGALGVGHWPTNMVEDGRRWGVHAALLPGLRDAITLRSSTRALRLIIEDGRCRGVVVDGPNGEEELRADHLVLAAGAYNTPELLLRSGIGPRDDLEAAGIPVVVDAPGVGRNLQDHPWAVLQVTATDPEAPGRRPVNGSLLRYQVQVPGEEGADRIEVHLYPHQAKPYLPDADPADAFVGIGLMRAISRGEVRLAADGRLEIRLRHLSDPQDAAAFRLVLDDAARYVDDMVAAGVFHDPGDAWWRTDVDAGIAANLESYGHAVGTARMGRDGDPMAVVDERLAVRGVAGLSVVDASVMPASPRANTMLASMMVGHRGGSLVAAALLPPATAHPERTPMLIDPERLAATLYAGAPLPAAETREIREPATGGILGRVAVASASDVDPAVARLRAGQVAWAATPQAERAAVLRRAGTLLEEQMPQLADWLVREGGMTVGKAMFELTISAQAFHAASGLTAEPVGELYPSTPGRLSISRRVPVGVVGVIAPFNSPLYLALRSVAPALALGNSVLVKPDPRTAISGGTVIAEALFQAGLPADVLAVLPGAADVGAAIIEHPDVPVIAFTGSTGAGRAIAVQAAQHLKRVHLELGGNSALVVFDDVDLDRATAAGSFGSFMHSGQICMSSSRHLVHAAVADEYVARLAERADRLVVDNPALNPAAMIGPLIDERQRDAVHDLVTATRDAGARLATGGTFDGLLYRPTVLAGVEPGMPAYDREIFGPVAPVTVFHSFDEAVELANGSEYGLSLGVLTRDVARGLAFADRAVSGNVHINDQTLVDDVIQPFGGVKASGNGSRVGSSRANADAFTEQQWVTVQPEISFYPF